METLAVLIAPKKASQCMAITAPASKKNQHGFFTKCKWYFLVPYPGQYKQRGNTHPKPNQT